MNTNTNANSNLSKTSVFTFLTQHVSQATSERDLPSSLRFVFFGMTSCFPDENKHRKHVYRYPTLDGFVVVSPHQAAMLANYLEIDCSPFAFPSDGPAIERCNKQKVDKQLSTYITTKASLSSSWGGRWRKRDLCFICFGEVSKVNSRGKSNRDSYKVPDLGSVEYITEKQLKEIVEFLGKPDEELADGYKPFLTITVRPGDGTNLEQAGSPVRPPAPYYVIHCGLQTRYIYCGDAYDNRSSHWSDDDEYYPEWWD